MKPVAFRYFAPHTLGEALELLAEHGEDGKVLAGGQSLVPAMNFRLARPASLIDINRIAGLDYIREEDGALCIGALARHARFEAPVIDGALGAFLPRVARHIAHLPIRTRGTFGGSLAHADPASEWCLVAATLDAELVTASRGGSRRMRPNEYFVTALTTTLETNELLTEIRLPLLGPEWRMGFAEFSRRAGDYALAMCAAGLRIENGGVAEAHIGIGGATGRPQRIPAAEQVLIGGDAGPEIRREAGNIAAQAIEPLEDVQASAEYRRDLVRAMVERALRQACGG
ncbi:MAG: xanthine dehydrogenase family protein subunit M [Alphaproteobacteria bacterium]|nr:xanthine dehydrogenase family protein subunit M [Alphaproteobacteria bacterium]MBV9586999.1 xanthine dehydrogenase family protein subunit M [Alphaproteobacteria bacterium]MBV9966359.1 xanthine dehydrogenase family protein subunit M [Alphaproteobacteria bacterium]